MGLVAMRLADSIILPLNTTHYAYELDKYLDKYVLVTRGVRRRLTLAPELRRLLRP